MKSFSHIFFFLLFILISCFAFETKAQVWIKVGKKMDGTHGKIPVKQPSAKQEKAIFTPSDKLLPVGVVRLTASYTVSKKQICFGDSIVFNYRGNGKSFDDLEYHWAFPDSVSFYHTKDQNTVVGHFLQPGMYVIKIQLSGDIKKYWPSKVFADSIEVLPPPNPSFSISATKICNLQYLTVDFTGNFNDWGGDAKGEWTFDGGKVSLASSDMHKKVAWDVNCVDGKPIYKSITLKLTQDGCVAYGTKKVKIIAPSASIQVSTEKPCNGEEMTVIAKSCTKDSSTKYIWNFGSGIDANPPIDGALQKVTYYNISENITSDKIKLQIIQQGCISDFDSIALEIYPTILADYTVNKDTLHGAGIINFKIGDVFACNDGSEVKFNWNFPEGNIISSEKNKNIQVYFKNNYNTAVIFYPSLSITQDGCSSNVFSVPIYVSPIGAATHSTKKN
jgi:hypothetical protein